MIIYMHIISEKAMKIRRTISVEKSDIDTLKPLMDSCGNNLSQALRHLIDYYRKGQKMKIIDEETQKKIVLRNQIIETRIAILIPLSLVRWMLKSILGLPPLGVFRPIIEKLPKLFEMENFSVNDYVKLVNSYGDILGYQIRQHVEIKSNNIIHIMYESEDGDNLRNAVAIYSCMLAHHPFNLKVKKVIDSPNLVIIDHEQCSSEEEAYKSVIAQFGNTQILADETQKNILYWKNLAFILKADHYQDIIINKDILFALIKGKDFSNQMNNLILTIYSVSIEDIDYHHIIRYIDDICKTNGFLQEIEYNDKEIRLYHFFDDEGIINIVNQSIVKTLKLSGQLFMIRKNEKITILSRATR